MVQPCAICLSPYDNPVSTPCGHIFCTECISDHILASSDGFRSPCPTCRTKFHISVPELRYLPRQYHQFILPSLRRVFLDSSPNPQVEKLKAELKDAKSRISSQKRRLKEQSKEHSLAMSKLKKQLDAERKQTEGFKTAFTEMEYHRDKYYEFRKAFRAAGSSLFSSMASTRCHRFHRIG
ncbi:hypothetical protein EV421DRAFT_1825914 [Armillaria borealis]|uniref:RING-type domain-containing protein n=1 Tax=Armillaria borealis TaxID=47425 RepID=A0AA39MKU6_9AGAR|nr:hypothetical protein EV421DRAFT_1825914 [Armillaria borealis]